MQKDIYNSIKALENGQTILYPTDTIWGIGCDATDPLAVTNVYALKKRIESKALICLVSDIEMLESFVELIPNKVRDIIKDAKKPTTIIYSNPKNFAKNLLAEDGSIGIRLVTSGFAYELIKKFKKPIVSTSANYSGEPSPKSFKEISQGILKEVDYVVNLQGLQTETKPSSIIKLNDDGTVHVIRH